MIKKRIPALAAVLFSIQLLTASCHTSQEAGRPSLSSNAAHNPAFLDNVHLADNRQGKSVCTNAGSTRSNSAAIRPADANAMQIKYADILGVLPQAIHNVPLYAAVDSWLGTRYRLGGMDHSGIDCSAFVQQVFSAAFGMNLLRTAAEQATDINNLIFKKDELKEGDLVFFHIHGSRISHVGIYLMNNFFVHASVSRGVMISNLNEDYWQRYYACAGRVL